MHINPGESHPIEIIENDINSIPIIDSIIIADAPQCQNNNGVRTLDVNAEFMSSRFWNLSEETQSLIMDKLGTDKISN